jgi:hypothetical protein
MKRFGYALCIGLGFGALPLVSRAATVAELPLFQIQVAQETSAELLADQVRGQGYPCEGSVRAERDPARSRPDEAVWILNCAKESYRVRLVPDMAAIVQRLK